MMKLGAWIRRPDVLDYIVESYAGVEQGPSPRGRRVFLWEEAGLTYMGNCEAFLQHLARRFELVLTLSATSQVHHLLRELGETVYQTAAERATPVKGRKSFKQPEPDQWVVPQPPGIE